ncbi:autophagy protein 5 [Hortaea werneckii]|uniref:Autophagy protein 5 n=1 Tax=Hortaea werneckii TaxID=91943 RepID=A0A3M7DPB8_HORWE|nr:autophagy protein 5 [Hortaea werneckii]KAI7531531.1 autophagy protein 5 [Hortaea werneckii]KAI7576882.1 autophagy protein 5 [Hortaea werneckii]KAI7584849.1 autophagy protein 5 [Hortaea werneckii]KAI7616959.1 autophagy protein 5 [Hortaea werneckii]
MPPTPSSSAPPAAITSLQQKIWHGSLPLEIRLAAADCRTYDQSDPYLIQYPRLSYLAFLLPRLHAIFSPNLIDAETPPHTAWLDFEGVPLKWHYPLGLLYDLYSGAEPVHLQRGGGGHPHEDVRGSTAQHQAPRTGDGEGDHQEVLPWRLTIHYSEFPGDQLIPLDGEGKALQDSFVNAVKEADFLRNGTARTVMGLSMEDSEKLWRSVQTHDLQLFNSVNVKLLNPPGMELRHVPVKFYLPTSSATDPAGADTIPEETKAAGHVRVVQSLIPLQLPSKQPQTLGTALNSVLPSIFPSRRNPLLAQPVLHGAAVPMGANLVELGRAAGYLDGFLHVVVVMLA